MENFNFDHEFDVVVIGTGNGGLTSAICSRDGGASLRSARQLYRQIEKFQNASFQREFGRLWK